MSDAARLAIQTRYDRMAEAELSDRGAFEPLSCGGMPWWKWISNRALTALENAAFGLTLAEHHTGYRAYVRQVLESCHFQVNSDGFVFDQELIAQAVAAGFRITEISVPVRYFPEASSANFFASCLYGVNILFVIVRYLLHHSHAMTSRQLLVLQRRYRRVG